MNQLHHIQTKATPISRHIVASTLDGALDALSEHGTAARPIAGGTDLLLELARNGRPGIEVLVDLSRIPGLSDLTMTDGRVHIGALVTHGAVIGWEPMRRYGLPLAQACLEVGSPQLRNRATVVGNIVTASPANDTISALFALDADVMIASLTGSRTVPITEFCTGFRETALRPGELVTGITFDALTDKRRAMFVKLGLRRAQAISVVHAAVVVETNDDDLVTDLRIALGSVAATVVIVAGAAEMARGQRLKRVAADVGVLASDSVTPIDDLRATADYRSRTVRVVVTRALLALDSGVEAEAWPVDPPLLNTCGTTVPETPVDVRAGTPVTTTINDQIRTATNAAGKTLLDWIRDDLGLTGTKEGCAEGECGACTVHVNGAAVLSCLVPAALAHGADITTVEGIAVEDSAANEDVLDPVQAAFEECGGVQCGFCTPGFVMSAAMLTAEVANPSRSQIEHGLAGNLCRCTGYYPILEAVERAAASDPAKLR